MIDIKKVIVFLFVIILLTYMIRLSYFVRKKYKFRSYTFSVLFVGMFLIAVATFLDMIFFMIKSQFIYVFMRTCFTIGAVIYILGVILWGNYTKKVIEKFEEMALKDCMTGAFNRSGIERVYKMMCEEKNPFYIIVCDLDGMKRINDKYGHLMGDRYIIRTVESIRDVIGLRGYVGRIGGDEFIVVLEYQDVEQIRKIEHKIKKLVYELFSERNTGISVGYSVFPNDGHTLEELIKVADKKMYDDKAIRKMHA